MNKDAQHREWQDALDSAYGAGMLAATRAVPQPMVVGTPKNMLASLMGQDDGGFDPDQPTYFVSEGACGFAWVNVRKPQTFRNWLEGKVKSNFPAATALRQYGETWRETSAVNPPRYSSYDRATGVWVGGFGQSVARKEAFANAFANVLRERLSVEAYSGSRLD